MKLLAKRKDGGPDSNVTGYWLIEWKSVFSIALLQFSQGSREAFHSHAFNSISWVLKGEIQEHRKYAYDLPWYVQLFVRVGGVAGTTVTDYKPSFKPVHTTRDNLHKVFGIAPATWVLTFRGPWAKTWREEFPDGRVVTLTDGRIELNT